MNSTIPKKLQREAINGLPDSALRDCLFLTGKRGYGKSYSQRNAMERALTLGMRCGWVDAMGIGWGITVAADGSPGFPNVVVFGGEHAHLPISEGSGAALGAVLARAKFSWVLDLTSLRSKAARVRFMADFCEALYEANRDQLLLFLDEIDLWAPQQIIGEKNGPAATLLGIIDEIIRRGRIKGLSAWMATQRPAVVSKNVISQADGVVTLKLTLPHDIDAVMLWMKKHLGKVRAAEFEIKIPSLKKGEALVYITEPEVTVSVAQFPPIKTLDNMKPREAGDPALAGQRATIDLEAVRAQLGEVEIELQATDPRHLQSVIAGLRKELRERAAVATTHSSDTVELNAEYRRGFIRGEAEAIAYAQALWADHYGKHLESWADKIAELPACLREYARDMRVDLQSYGGTPKPQATTEAQERPTAHADIARTIERNLPHASQLREQPPIQTSDTDLPGNGIGLLKKICELYPVKLTWGQVTALLGRKARGGTFNHQRKVMLERGLVVESSDIVTPTAAGFALAGVAQSNTELPPAKLRELWQGVLPDPAGRMFAALTRRGKGWHHLSVIAQDLGMAGTGGHWNNGIATLRRNGLAEMQGKEAIRLAGWLL